MSKKYVINPKIKEWMASRVFPVKVEGPMKPTGFVAVNAEFFCWSCGKIEFIKGDMNLIPQVDEGFFIVDKKAQEKGWLIEEKIKDGQIERIEICPECIKEE